MAEYFKRNKNHPWGQCPLILHVLYWTTMSKIYSSNFLPKTFSLFPWAPFPQTWKLYEQYKEVGMQRSGDASESVFERYILSRFEIEEDEHWCFMILWNSLIVKWRIALLLWAHQQYVFQQTLPHLCCFYSFEQLECLICIFQTNDGWQTWVCGVFHLLICTSHQWLLKHSLLSDPFVTVWTEEPPLKCVLFDFHAMTTLAIKEH